MSQVFYWIERPILVNENHFIKFDNHQSVTLSTILKYPLFQCHIFIRLIPSVNIVLQNGHARNDF